MSGDVQNAFRFLVLLEPLDALELAMELGSLALGEVPGAFQSCSGLGGTLEVTAYAEGGRNDYVHQLPVRHSWSPITLSRGIAGSPALFAWYKAGLFGSLGARRDGAIVMLSRNGMVTMVWIFTGGLAASWTGPEFDAQQDGLAIEKLEIVHQGLKCIPGVGVAGVA